MKTVRIKILAAATARRRHGARRLRRQARRHHRLEQLRCAVVLDFPPMGSRNAQNFSRRFTDVDYTNDLAKTLGVKAEIVRRTRSPTRIPR